MVDGQQLSVGETGDGGAGGATGELAWVKEGTGKRASRNSESEEGHWRLRLRLGSESPTTFPTLRQSMTPNGRLLPVPGVPRWAQSALRGLNWQDGYSAATPSLIFSETRSRLAFALLPPRDMPGLSILIIGNGGREHALVWRLSQSPTVDKIYVCPGNGGTALESKAVNVNLSPSDFPSLVDFALKNEVFYHHVARLFHNSRSDIF